jgi:3-isopropylmalate/(R)-2-methylmalate dehydratase small subunit
MSLPMLQGRVAWVFGEDDYDIDLIVGVRNIKITDVAELARLAMGDYEAGFAATVRPGDLLVGGRNFGYGHPHYPAMRAMRHLGIAGVVAESFSPGFFRGEISMGFPLITCPGICAAAARGDELRVDWAAGQVSHLRTGLGLPLQPLSAAERGTLEAGGLIPYLQRRLGTPATR